MSWHQNDGWAMGIQETFAPDTLFTLWVRVLKTFGWKLSFKQGAHWTFVFDLGFPAIRVNIFAKISHFVREKNTKISRKQNFENFGGRKCESFAKKYGREINNYDLLNF